MNSTCKYCGFTVSENFYFCPNCGKKLQEKLLSTSIGKQIYIYGLSILLPPLGLLPGFKYLLNKDPKAKLIGIVAIILTITSIIVTIWFFMQFLNTTITGPINQLDQLQNQGY